jgi:hypothetical protein
MQNNFELILEQKKRLAEEAYELAKKVSELFLGKNSLLVFNALCTLMSSLFDPLSPESKEDLKNAFIIELNKMTKGNKKDAAH